MNEYKIYPYRWIILLTMIPILAMTNVFWLTFAPITAAAEKFYNVSPIGIAFLSMSYMLVYIIMVFPASWFVDTKGFRVAMGIGALTTAGFGMLRGIYAENFVIVTIAQLGVAIGQPFLVNSITKVAARWFPVKERATASGLATMAGYLGMIIAMILTPLLADNYGIERMLMLYGYASIVCALIFIAFSKERPQTPPGPGEELVEKLSIKGIKQVIGKKDFNRLMICLFVIMGIFNAVMTWIEDIVKARGITSTQAGMIGGILVVVGLAGAIILPIISDKLGKRCPTLYFPILAAIPGFLGLIFFKDYSLLLAAAGIMGFFIMGMGPIAFQYGAEIAYPIPEGTSYGLLMITGQISGILFIYIMDALRSPATGSMTFSLVLFTLLIFIVFFLAKSLKESKLLTGVTMGASSENKATVDAETLEKAREMVCEAGRRLLRSGLVSGTWGNISCRINDDFMVITPSGREYELLTPADMVLVNIKDNSYEGDIKPSGERGLHVEIYRSRKEINAVIHTHSANASTVAAARREVPPLLDDMAQIIGPSVRVADYALPGTKKLIKATVKALTGRNAALLANHGAICAGRSLEEAFVACEILEKSCRTFIESEFIGGGKPINPIEAWVMHQYFLKKYSKQKEM